MFGPSPRTSIPPAARSPPVFGPLFWRPSQHRFTYAQISLIDRRVSCGPWEGAGHTYTHKAMALLPMTKASGGRRCLCKAAAAVLLPLIVIGIIIAVMLPKGV